MVTHRKELNSPNWWRGSLAVQHSSSASSPGPRAALPHGWLLYEPRAAPSWVHSFCSGVELRCKQCSCAPWASLPHITRCSITNSSCDLAVPPQQPGTRAGLPAGWTHGAACFVRGAGVSQMNIRWWRPFQNPILLLHNSNNAFSHEESFYMAINVLPKTQISALLFSSMLKKLQTASIASNWYLSRQSQNLQLL